MRPRRVLVTCESAQFHQPSAREQFGNQVVFLVIQYCIPNYEAYFILIVVVEHFANSV